MVPKHHPRALPELLEDYNQSHAADRQTLDGYINYWVLRSFIIVKGNQRGKIEMHAVVSPSNVSHRRAAELTGGTVLNIESDFSAPLAALLEARGIRRTHLTLTDERGLAAATVILECDA